MRGRDMNRMIFFTVAPFLFLIAGCHGMEEPVSVGGWTERRPDAEIVQSAFAFAAKEAAKRYAGLKLSSPRRAETQVVAGTNIRMECPYELAEKRGIARIIVYDRLDGTKELTDLVLSAGER